MMCVALSSGLATTSAYCGGYLGGGGFGSQGSVTNFGFGGVGALAGGGGFNMPCCVNGGVGRHR